MQPGHILLQEAPPPLADGGVGQSQLARNLQVRLPRSTQQNNLGPTHEPRRKRARTGQAFELSALLRTQNQSRFRSSHGHKHPPFCTGDAYIPSNTIAIYLWDSTLALEARTIPSFQPSNRLPAAGTKRFFGGIAESAPAYREED